MIRCAFAVASLFTLGGCASLAPNPPAAATITCPPLVAYSALEQQALADELAKDGTESQIQIEDYIKLRGACRK